MSAKLPPGRIPSIRDVARLAGVSYQTVSRVLNHHPSVRDDTKARVLQVMEETQYRPNQAARALATKHSRTIGVLSASNAQYGPARSVAAIEDAAREAGYYVNTANLSVVDPESIAGAIGHLMEQAIEGLVVIAPQVRVFDVLAKLSIDVPYVSLQSTADTNPRTLSADQIAGGLMATRHLIELGHREIIHLAGPQDWIEAEARMQGYLVEIDKSDLSAYPPLLGDWTAKCGYLAGRELLRSREFTAVFAANDQMALGLLHAFRDEGLDVPRDVSVVGFDDIPDAEHYLPPLTTVRQDHSALGRRAVALLLGEAAGGDVARDARIMPELVVRSSTGPARGR
ncbi:LacI family DNA-binding transcriptional regulator [Pengzhenrongella frigida]|uniref:LacI family DNA-binding transcriptional regulator n=1 Tax=Pengzhenrongella frigida TaxID=1259133 RepID=A0A4Q5N1U8_9MICO|nr:LacI family DNA-binding transcriptional regulator [Cellulomonas sp. HLT2-17]RYV50517.1 LacI family DNA-binding transcriptional regulator [Cellulomonas sp. HLT2-17]